MIHICLATDDQYVHYTMMCIYDIVIRQDPTTELTFYILEDTLSEDSIAKLHQLDDLVPIVHIPVDAATLNKHRPEYIDHLSAAALLRVIIPELPELQDVERVLWLDSDTLCRRDITDLYNMDLQDQPIGVVKCAILLAFACPDAVSWKVSDVNAGLMLLDLPKLRELNYSNMMREALAADHKATYEKALYQTMRSHMTILPPICQIPYHNFVWNRFDTRRFYQLYRWNEFYDTNCESLREFIDPAYFFHFHENKAYYLRSPQIKLIYRTSEQRLAEYLATKKKMSWTPEDDRVFLDPCDDIINSIIALMHEEWQQQLAEQEKKQSRQHPLLHAWDAFDRMYRIHNLDNPRWGVPSYHETNRIFMARNDRLYVHNSKMSGFDDLIYGALDHTFFDTTVTLDQRWIEVNRMITYHDLFTQLLGTNINHVLIVRDQMLFLKEHDKVHQLLRHLPENWDYIKFSRMNGPAELDRYKSSLQEREYYHRDYTGGWLGSICCAYSRAAMELAVKIMEEQVLRMDYVLENRDDDRLSKLRRYVSSYNLAVDVTQPFYPNYTNIAEPDDYWSPEEYYRTQKGGTGIWN